MRQRLDHISFCPSIMQSVSSSDIGTSLPEGRGSPHPPAGVMLTFPAETPQDNQFQDNGHMMMMVEESEWRCIHSNKIVHYLLEDESVNITRQLLRFGIVIEVEGQATLLRLPTWASLQTRQNFWLFTIALLKQWILLWYSAMPT